MLRILALLVLLVVTPARGDDAAQLANRLCQKIIEASATGDLQRLSPKEIVWLSCPLPQSGVKECEGAWQALRDAYFTARAKDQTGTPAVSRDVVCDPMTRFR